jgi:hypothetical protein
MHDVIKDGARGARAELPASWPAAARGTDAETVDVVDLGADRRPLVANRRDRRVLGLALARGSCCSSRRASPATRRSSCATATTGRVAPRAVRGGRRPGRRRRRRARTVLKSPLETELQVLGSRDVLGHVVDSLGLATRDEPARRAEPVGGGPGGPGNVVQAAQLHVRAAVRRHLPRERTDTT